ncbi:hypothetical protein [Actinomyces vulturis]|uniref:hypothetical protein n=1 Tax=Actinomyces vulturis TaxID=1857645 RepID=UPI000832B62F|nr:hypothetical protein [Actinomyces vulturis]
MSTYTSPHAGKTRNILVATLAVITAFVLAACGAKVDTLVTVNDGDDPGGSRVMTLHIADTTNTKDRVHGGLDAVDKSIRDHLPPELEYSGISQVGKEATATFTLNFDNIEDYQTKAQALLDAGNLTSVKARVVYSNTQDKLANGLIYSENFSSTDLLHWIPDALFDDGVIEKSDMSSVLSDGGSKFIIAGHTFEDSYGYPSFADVVNNGVKHVTVEVVIKDDGTYGLNVVFDDRERINKPRQQLLKDWFTNHSPEGTAVEDLTNDGNITGVTASYSTDNPEDLSAALQQILAQPEASVTFEAPSPEPGALEAMKQVKILAPCEGICSTEGSYEPRIDVAVVVPSAWNAIEPYGFAGNDTVTINGSEGVFVFSKPVTIVNPTLTTSIGLDRSVTQTLEVVITDDLDDQMIESVKAALSPNNVFGDVSVSDYDKDGVKGKKFTLKAHAKNATAYNTLLRKAYGESTFGISMDDGWPKDKYILTTDSTMLNRLLGSSVQGTVGDYLDLPFNNKVDKEDLKYGVVAKTDGKIDLVANSSDAMYYHQSVQVRVTGPSQSDLIVDAVVLGLLLIALAVGGFFLRKYAQRRKEAGLPLFGQPAQTVLVPAGAPAPAMATDPQTGTFVTGATPSTGSAVSANTGAFPTAPSADASGVTAASAPAPGMLVSDEAAALGVSGVSAPSTPEVSAQSAPAVSAPSAAPGVSAGVASSGAAPTNSEAGINTSQAPAQNVATGPVTTETFTEGNLL